MSPDTANQTIDALQEIAVELIEATNDQNLLSLVVLRATQLLNCDGGSLYLWDGKESLTFQVAVNQSIPVNFEKASIALSGSGIVCYAFNQSRSVRIKDVYDLPEDAPFTFNRTFDQESGYRTRSVIALPLISSQGEKLGVVQLMNRKQHPNEKWPYSEPALLEDMPEFSERDEKLLKTFGAIASASIEKSNLYRNIQGLFEGFVHASVQAIESRDPVTSGHSERVAALTIRLARTSSRVTHGPFKDVNFNEKQIREIEYASLLHDFGKISVKENTLLKAKKLYPEELLKVENRFQRFRLASEISQLRGLLNLLVKEGRAPMELDIVRLEKQIGRSVGDIETVWNTILELNEPTVLDENKSEKLAQIAHLFYATETGEELCVLEPHELTALSIRKGSLSNEERLEIENHVTSTFNFLSRIPWTKDLAFVPGIAHAHHEKLNGTGYPRRLSAPEIPLQSRMMTICDIYDALVAADRPYKKAMPVEKALQILSFEVKDGALDKDLYDLFIEAKVYEDPRFLSLNRPKKAA